MQQLAEEQGAHAAQQDHQPLAVNSWFPIPLAEEARQRTIPALRHAPPRRDQEQEHAQPLVERARAQALTARATLPPLCFFLVLRPCRLLPLRKRAPSQEPLNILLSSLDPPQAATREAPRGLAADCGGGPTEADLRRPKLIRETGL